MSGRRPASTHGCRARPVDTQPLAARRCPPPPTPQRGETQRLCRPPTPLDAIDPCAPFASLESVLATFRPVAERARPEPATRPNLENLDRLIATFRAVA